MTARVTPRPAPGGTVRPSGPLTLAGLPGAAPATPATEVHA